MQTRYKVLFILAGAVMIWLGVKLLLAALTAGLAFVGGLMIFVGMLVIVRTSRRGRL